MCYVVLDLEACQFGNIPQKKSGSLAQARSIIHRNVSTLNLGEDCLYLEQFNNQWSLHEVLCKDIKSIVIWVASQPLFGVVLGFPLLFGFVSQPWCCSIRILWFTCFWCHTLSYPQFLVLLLVSWLLRFCSLVHKIWSVFGLVPFKNSSLLGIWSNFGVIVVLMFLNAMEIPNFKDL